MSLPARFLCVVLLASAGAQRQCTEVWVGKANMTTRDPIRFEIFDYTPVDSIISIPDLCYMKQRYKNESDLWHTAAGKIEVCDANGPPNVALEEYNGHFPLRVKCRLFNCICMYITAVLYCEHKGVKLGVQ